MQDALDEIARQKPRDVFKPLRVHFIGEDGIDAGGVKKEFFQLLVTELLCPDYGMLIFQPVRTFPSSPPPAPPHTSDPCCPFLLHSAPLVCTCYAFYLIACAWMFVVQGMWCIQSLAGMHSLLPFQQILSQLLICGLEEGHCTSPLGDLVRLQTQATNAHSQ